MDLSKFFLAILLSTAFTLATTGQTPTPTPIPEEDDRPVRITTSLIQVDVQVTGKDGSPVTGLTAEDFQIFQDGKPQQIVAVSYVDGATGGRTVISRKGLPKSERKIDIPPAGTRSGRGRLITFVLDDGNCLATIDGLADMRDSVRRFISDHMLPDDRVAIYRTAGGASLMQPYTSNKEVLRRLTSRISLLRSRGCGSSFEPARDLSTVKITGSGAQSFENEESAAARKQIEANERRNSVVGTLGVLRFVVDRLKNSPQRKTIFLISEGIYSDWKDDTLDSLRDLADNAARSSVVINTLSSKGVTVPGFISAQDEVLPGIINGTDNTAPLTEARRNEEQILNEGLAYLANETGGKFIRNSNRLEVDVRRTADQQSSYYLIAYEPDDATFRGKSYHRIDVKVNDPALVVSARNGFYGRSDKEIEPVYKNADSPLYQAISSPFTEDGLDVRLTLLYGNKSGGNDGHYLRALLHFPGSELGLVPDANGGQKTELDLVAVVLDEKGKVVEEFNRTYPIKIPRAGLATVAQNGLEFSTDIPIKKPGIYSFRIAVRNATTKRVGSAGDFVEIPDAKKRDLMISGLVATTVGNDGKPSRPSERPIGAAFAPIFTLATASVRQYAPGAALVFTYEIYNVRGSALTREVRIYREGKEVDRTAETPITTSTANGSRIEHYGVIRLTTDLEPGDYALQVIVRDKANNKTAAQWVDFSVY